MREAVSGDEAVGRWMRGGTSMMRSARPSGAARASRRASGVLEGEVMAVLWAADGPLTAGQVHESMGPDLAYKTVLTVLARLHEKGLCDREQVGRAHAYAPRRAQAELAAEKMSAALSAGADRAEVMLHFVATLDPDAHSALRAALDRVDPAQPETPGAPGGAGGQPDGEEPPCG